MTLFQTRLVAPPLPPKDHLPTYKNTAVIGCNFCEIVTHQVQTQSSDVIKGTVHHQKLILKYFSDNEEVILAVPQEIPPERLESGTLSQSACTCSWTNISLSNRMQRNYTELKITACLPQSVQLWTIRYKATDQLPLRRQEQKQGTAHDPCAQRLQVNGQNTEPTLQPQL